MRPDASDAERIRIASAYGLFVAARIWLAGGSVLTILGLLGAWFFPDWRSASLLVAGNGIVWAGIFLGLRVQAAHMASRRSD